MKVVNMKVISYCEIPQELTDDTWLSEITPDVYTEYSLPSLEEKDKYELDSIDEWLENNYLELIGTTFLIHIDY